MKERRFAERRDAHRSFSIDMIDITKWGVRSMPHGASRRGMNPGGIFLWEKGGKEPECERIGHSGAASSSPGKGSDLRRRPAGGRAGWGGGTHICGRSRGSGEAGRRRGPPRPSPPAPEAHGSAAAPSDNLIGMVMKPQKASLRNQVAATSLPVKNQLYKADLQPGIKSSLVCVGHAGSVSTVSKLNQKKNGQERRRNLLIPNSWRAEGERKTGTL